MDRQELGVESRKVLPQGKERTDVCQFTPPKGQDMGLIAGGVNAACQMW